MLNGAPPKHDDMQCVAYVPEMSHFHAQMGRIFVDQLSSYSYLCRLEAPTGPERESH
jgi:hypothetical protein